MTKPRYLERNTELIRNRLIKQIDISLDKGNKFIEKELSSSAYALIKPLIKFFYSEIKRKDMEKGSYIQIDLCLKAAKDVVLENISLDFAIERYFQSYLKSDQTSQTLKKHHNNYPMLVDNIKKTYKAQVIPLIALLKNDSDEMNTYEELAKDTFKTKEKTLNALTGQFEYMEWGLKTIEQDKSILNLPMGRDILLKILIQGFTETKNELVSETEAMFNE
jgi:hypothetical protein